MKHVVAVDVGFGYVKVLSTDEGRRAIFPALIGSSIARKDIGLGSKQVDDETNIEIKIHQEGSSKSYFVGELAKTMLEETPVFEKNRCNERTLHLIATAIQLVNPNNEPVYLVTGLPLEQFKVDKKDFKSYLDGKGFDVEWVSGTHKGKTIHSEISTSYICPQGAAAIIASISKADGSYKYPEYMFEGSRIALIDVGFRTTDVVVVEVGKNNQLIPVENMSFTIDDLGMSNLSADIMGHFKDKYKQDMASFMLQQALKNVPFAVNGKKTDYTEIVKELKINLAGKIAIRVKQRWRENESTLSCAFLSGGGAKDLENTLKTQFKTNTIPVEDSQYANVVGYLRTAKAFFAKLDKAVTAN